MEKVFSKNNKPVWIGLIIIAFWGILMSFMVPTWQTPDESQHTILIGDSLGIDDLFITLNNDDDLDFTKIMYNYDEKVDVEEWQDSMTKEPSYDVSDVTPTTVSPSVITHLPQTIGMLIGLEAHAPTFWVLTLGELFSFAFYFVMLILALKLMPVQKELFLVIAALPMVIHQVGSINYDSVLLPLCFLFIAYVFHLKHMQGNVKWKHIIVFLILIALIAYVKIPYAMMIFFICLVPKEKFELKIGKKVLGEKFIRTWRIPLLIAIVVLIVLAVMLLSDRIFYFGIIKALFQEPGRAIYLYANTIRSWAKFLLTSFVGYFGWLDAPLPIWFVLISLLTMLFLAITGPKTTEKWSTRIFVWIIVLIFGMFIIASMIDFTVNQIVGPNFGSYNEALYQIPFVGGLQGRYFIPFVPLALYVLPKFKTDWKWRKWIPTVYIALAMIVSICVVYNRYWA